MSKRYFGYRVHPAADKFPMVDQGRLEDLASDIKTNGQKVKIQLVKDGDESLIIDGRNRAAACELAGVQPQFETIICGNPYQYVWSLNGHRRDLTDIQRGVIFLSCQEGAEAFEDARREAAEKKQAAMAEKAEKERQVKNDPLNIPAPAVTQIVRSAQNNSGQVSRDEYKPRPTPEPRERKRENEATATIAAKAGISRATMEKAKTIVNSGKENAEAVARGVAKPTEVLRQIRNTKKIERIRALPSGQYHVIYADPPWQYNDKRETGDHRESTGAEHHYPTMSLADLKAMDVKGLAAPDCALLCWATFPLLPDALDLLKTWGFTYKTAFIWDKGFGAFGHYHNAAAELLLIATRGSGVPQSEKRADQVQSFPREEHSRKPAAWRELIDQLYPEGTRIELFRRGDAPSGWDVWGAEAETTEAEDAA